MRQLLALSISLAISFPCIAQEKRGENCDLETPPTTAGETFFGTDKLTVVGRVYPRLSEIATRYTGCQVVWISMNSRPATRSVTFFVDGRVVFVNPLPDDIPLCKADEKSAETGCTSRRSVVAVSFPPGCTARTHESKAIPKDCMDAFMAEFRLNDRIAD
ncbi:MAG: hypothetical protein JF585_13300 [Burkholderiales bacterium]|nr:hypothetical protein [Burkholderiales bacterium]